MWAVGGAAADHAAAVHIVRRVAGIHSPHVRAERYRIAMRIHLLIVEVVVALRIGTERRIVLVGCQHQWCARPMRPGLLLTAGLLIIVAALAAAVYFWSPRANLRVTTGPPGSTAYRFITAFASVTEANHPRIHIKLVQVADLAASAKAIEDHATDLGIVRSDAVIPSTGATIAILRRDVVAFVLPAKSPIDKISSLAGKTIGIPQGPLQTYNEQTLDAILSYYNIPASSVKRVFLPLAEIGAAVHDKHVAAVLAVGPIGPGEIVDVVGAIKLATKGAPGILAIDEAG